MDAFQLAHPRGVRRAWPQHGQRHIDVYKRQIQDRAAAAVGAEAVVPAYCVGLIATAAGYLLLPLSRALVRGEAARRAMLVCAGAIFLCSFGLIVFVGSVSYTHLDVYKRQVVSSAANFGISPANSMIAAASAMTNLFITFVIVTLPTF